MLCSSSSDEESAQQAHIAGEILTLKLTPHRTFGVASVSPAVLIPFATPCLSGARGTTSTGRPDGRLTGISSRGARLGQGGDEGHAGRTSRLDKASSGGRGDRAVKRGRRTTLDGQPSGPTLAEQNGAPRTTRGGLGQRRARARSLRTVGHLKSTVWQSGPGSNNWEVFLKPLQKSSWQPWGAKRTVNF